MNSAELKLMPQLEPYRGLIVPLIEDVQGLTQVANDNDTLFTRRATIKTLFSVLEGAVNLGKQYLLDNFSNQYTPQEIVADDQMLEGFSKKDISSMNNQPKK